MMPVSHTAPEIAPPQRNTSVEELPDFDYDGDNGEPKVHIIDSARSTDQLMFAYCGIEIGQVLDGHDGPRADRCIPCQELYNEWRASHL